MTRADDHTAAGALSAADQIRNLLGRYTESIDAADFAGVGALFAHGRLALVRDDPGSDIVGADAVAAFYGATVRVHDDGTPRTHHLTTNTIIEFDTDDTATARSAYTVFMATDDYALQPMICGRYHDHFHVVDGAWWFASRHMTVSLVGDLSRHLTIDLP